MRQGYSLFTNVVINIILFFFYKYRHNLQKILCMPLVTSSYIVGWKLDDLEMVPAATWQCQEQWSKHFPTGNLAEGRKIEKLGVLPTSTYVPLMKGKK